MGSWLRGNRQGVDWWELDQLLSSSRLQRKLSYLAKWRPPRETAQNPTLKLEMPVLSELSANPCMSQTQVLMEENVIATFPNKTNSCLGLASVEWGGYWSDIAVGRLLKLS